MQSQMNARTQTHTLSLAEVTGGLSGISNSSSSSFSISLATSTHWSTVNSILTSQMLILHQATTKMPIITYHNITTTKR